MVLTVVFLEDIDEIKKGTTISIDPDYKESVENAKVLISLKYHHLDISQLELVYNGKPLDDHAKLVQLGIKAGDILQARIKRETSHTLLYLTIFILFVLVLYFFSSSNSYESI